MKIEIANIDTIKPYENNPRKLSETAIEKVAGLDPEEVKTEINKILQEKN